MLDSAPNESVPASRTGGPGGVRESATAPGVSAWWWPVLGGLSARRRLMTVGLTALAALLAAWLAGRAAEQAALADLRRTAQASLTLHVAALRAEMEKQASLPLALATDPEIVASVGEAADPAVLARVSGRLAEVAGATGAAVIYVIRSDGLTVAASNAGGPTSFVGNNYAFRPYFREALDTGTGSQFALGTVSGRPGYYLARRVPGPRPGVAQAT